MAHSHWFVMIEHVRTIGDENIKKLEPSSIEPRRVDLSSAVPLVHRRWDVNNDFHNVAFLKTAKNPFS
jgi:hypothetical protein